MKALVQKGTAIMLLAAFPTLLGAKELQVEWGQLPKSLVEGRKLEVQLAGGGRLTGRAISAGPAGLQMEIAKVSSENGKYRPGVTTVEQGDILALKVRKPHVRGRIVGTIAGGAVGGTVAGMTVRTMSGEDVGGKLAAISIGLVAAGYFLGWLWDRSDVTTIHILAAARKPAGK